VTQNRSIKRTEIYVDQLPTDVEIEKKDVVLEIIKKGVILFNMPKFGSTFSH
jgi:hypothetical protein